MKFTLALLTLAAAVKVPDDSTLADLEAAVTAACGGEDLEGCDAAVKEYTDALMDMEEYYFELYGAEYGLEEGEGDDDEYELECSLDDDACWEDLYGDDGEDEDVCDWDDDSCWEDWLFGSDDESGDDGDETVDDDEEASGDDDEEASGDDDEEASGDDEEASGEDEEESGADDGDENIDEDDLSSWNTEDEEALCEEYPSLCEEDDDED